NKGWEVAWMKRVDRLQHPGVYSLGWVARQRPFRMHVGFEAHEGEPDCYSRVATETGDCGAVRTDAPSVGFVDIDPDVQRINRAHGHQWTGQLSCRRIFAQPNIHLKDCPVDRCLGHCLVEIGSRSIKDGSCLIELGFRLLMLCQEHVILLLRNG